MWILCSKQLHWFPSVLHSSLTCSLSLYTILFLPNSLESLIPWLPSKLTPISLLPCHISFARTIFHLWRLLPSKLSELTPTHFFQVSVNKTWKIIRVYLFLWYTLLFSFWGFYSGWGFYSEHLAQPVINYLYLFFLLSGSSDHRMYEGGAQPTLFSPGSPNLSKLPHLQRRLICRLHV